VAQHWLKSPQARDLPLGDVSRMSEDDSYLWFYRARWGDGEPCCAHCGVADAYRLTRNGRRWNRFKCRDRDCHREFTVTSNTIFADHKLSFRKMLEVLALAAHSVKGKAALQVSREIGVSYRSAWVMLMKSREALAATEPDYPLDGIVEIDGAWVGGHVRQENRAVDRADRRAVENRAPAGRQVITTLRQRPFGALRDRVFSTVTPGEVPRYAEDIVERKVARQAVILSDEHGAYAGLNRLNRGVVQVRHADALAFGSGINTNGVESHYSRVRRAELGIHHHISGKYLELYASSLAWYENTRRQMFSFKLRETVQACMDHPTSRKFCGYWQGVYPVEPLGWDLAPRM
jgi:transposase-like protein